jgi:hypothetical protein
MAWMFGLDKAVIRQREDDSHPIIYSALALFDTEHG